MSLKVLLLVALVALASAHNNHKKNNDKKDRTVFNLKAMFEDFKSTYGRAYETAEEEAMRFGHFKENHKISQRMNSEQDSAVYGVTRFSDLSAEEFKAMYLNKPATKPEDVANIPVMPAYTSMPKDAPASFNWADKPGVLTPVKDQEQCGSCWAFSVTECIESANALAGKGLKVLAPQQIVDCDTVDQGCNGGDPPTAYKYIQDAGGLELESDYPYTGADGKCAFDKSKVAASITGFKYVTQSKNETQMLISLPIDGPPSICVDASSWQNYQSGVVKKHCGTELDHCVQLTGYGTDGTTDYWIVRNSWNTNWGLNGFIWVERGHNMCGIAQEVTLATV